MEVKETVSRFGFQETVGILKRAIEENGLKVVSEINAQENLKRIGVQIGGNIIMEVFHPKLAKKVFDTDLRAGIVPPVRIYIYEQNSLTKIIAQVAESDFSPYGLADLGRSVDQMIESSIRSVR